MDELIAAVILIVVGGGTLAALLTVLLFLFPSRTNQVRHILETTPKRAFAVGLINFLFFMVLAAILAQGGEGLRLVALLLLLALLGLAVMGTSGLLLLLRGRIYGPSYSEPAVRTAASLKTAVILVAAGLAPLAGWFILSPLVLISGLGAVILTWFQRVPKPATVEPLSEDTLPY